MVEKNIIQVPTAKFRTWSQRGVSTDGGSYDYLRVRAESVPTFTFLQNGFEHQQKVKPNRTKTRFLKKFDIRREPKVSQKGATREPKGAKREPKIKKIIKNHTLERSKLFFFSLSFFFKIVKTVMAHL
jgi:hypothetical protein